MLGAHMHVHTQARIVHTPLSCTDGDGDISSSSPRSGNSDLGFGVAMVVTQARH